MSFIIIYLKNGKIMKLSMKKIFKFILKKKTKEIMIEK